MNRKKAIRNRALAGALTMAIISAGVVMVTDAVTSTDPAIHIEGLEVKMKTDPGTGKQSAQVLVELSVTNQGMLQGVATTLKYNKDYLEPSNWATNEGYGESGVESSSADFDDPSDPLHHLFFHTNPELYWDSNVDPLKFDRSVGNEGLYVRPNSQLVHIHTLIRENVGELDATRNDDMVKYAETQKPLIGYSGYYFENDKSTTENRVVFGTLSFRVNDKLVGSSTDAEDLEQKLKEIANKFDGLNWDYPVNDENSTLPAEKLDPSLGKEYLIREARDEELYPGGENDSSDKASTRKLTYIKELRKNPKFYQIETKNRTAVGIKISIEADDVIQKVWPVKDEITINSYQAYTNGDVGDLAIAMQNYAESIRVRRVSGKEQDMSIYWGDPVNNPASANMPDDGPGMFVQKAVYSTADGWTADSTTPRYRFKWNASGFAVERENVTPPATVGGTPTISYTPVTSSDIYGKDKLFDPRGNFDGQHGHYIISQYFTYWEATGSGGSGAMALKTFPKSVEVTLHVTPIHVVDASVERQQLTYRNDLDEVPQSYVRLDLADEAKLTLDTTINGLTPTMPVSWKPNSLATTVGTAGAGNPNYTVAAPGNVANWPVGATAIGNKTGIGAYTFTTKVLEADIQTKYPWITTDKDYDLESSRRIVDVKAPADPNDPSPLLPRYVMWAEPYEVTPGDAVAQLRITIARQEATWNKTTEEWDWDYVNMDPPTGVDYNFKLYMPNDQQIRADSTVNWFAVTLPSGAVQPSYTVSRKTGVTDADKGFSNLNIYEFVISPGDLNAGDGYAAQRETLRRYINLGGWFSADVLEPGEDWSDRISGYSRPRTNIHTVSYVMETPAPSVSPAPSPAPTPAPTPNATTDYLFDYTGDRAGLMPFYENSDLPTFITLPADETVEVRYDGVTGAQPGQMRQFKVKGDGATPERWENVRGKDASPTPDTPPWATPVPAASPSPAVPGEIVTYGADLFDRSHSYGDFGWVNNPDNPPAATGYPTTLKDRQAKIRVQVQDKIPATSGTPKWELKLTYEQTGDNVTEYTDGQVKRVTFDNKMEGYTYQQIVTLTVTNTGNMDIRGLHIDIPEMTNGPWFRLVTPPPAVLPVGASATFQLSYVLDLDEGTYENIFTTEPIYIWHDNSGPANDGHASVTLPGHTDEGFEAVLKITRTRPHKVTVVVHPTIDDDGKETKPMGDGWLVEGITTTGTGAAATDKYSNTLGANVYEEGSRFWVVTQPKDEYALIATRESGTVRTWVYYVRDDDPTQTKVYLDEYSAGGSNTGFGKVDNSFVTQEDNPERLFYGEMPDGSVTVHIHYYEPLLSKLRLSDLHAYAWDAESEIVLKPDPIPADAWVENSAITNKFDPLGYERPLNIHKGENNYEQILFQPEKDEYIVFLDTYGADPSTRTDNFCGVSIQLRDLVTHINGVGDTANPVESNNVDIYPTVMMTLDDAANTIVCNDVPDPSVVPPAVPSTPSTVGPTTHHSSPFSAPVDDPTQTSIAQTTVTITISYDGTNLVPPEGYESRVYKVRFVRQMEEGKAKHIALAGNSPYGMIENDASITNKNAAKAAFDVNNRFDGSAYTPVKAADLTNIYWPEAWEGGVNYDKDETALFVYAGQEFFDPGVKNIYNNAGDYIDGIMVTRSLEYVKLNSGGATPWDRFDVDPTVAANQGTVNLGEVPAVKGAIPGDTVTITKDGGSTSYDGTVGGLVSLPDSIRPGIYQLRYTYKDHDNTTDLYFTRPLIVLSPNGDVDADWQSSAGAAVRVANADREAIEQRFGAGTALPYELPSTTYSAADALVYKYRIVDANNDRNINNIDAGMIRGVTLLKLSTAPKIVEFYRPTDYINR